MNKKKLIFILIIILLVSIIVLSVNRLLIRQVEKTTPRIEEINGRIK